MTDPSAQLKSDLAKASERVCKHMNEDHTMSVLAYAHYFGRRPKARWAIMVEINAEGFVLEVDANYCEQYKNDQGSGRKASEKVLVPYSEPLVAAGRIRKVAVNMHFEAFHALGLMYKFRTGYFQDSVRQALTHMPKRILIPIALTPFLCLALLCSASTLSSLAVAPALTIVLCFLCDKLLEPVFLDTLKSRGVVAFDKRPFSLKQVLHTSVVGFLSLMYVAKTQLWLPGSSTILPSQTNEMLSYRQPQASFLCRFREDAGSVAAPRITLGWELYDILVGLSMRWKWMHMKKNAKPLRCSLGGVGGLHSFVVACLLLFIEYKRVTPIVAFGLLMEISSIFLSVRALDFSAVSRGLNALLDVCFAVSFIGIRLILVPIWAFEFLSIGWFPDRSEAGIQESDWGTCMSRSILIIATLAAAILCGMNAWWGSTIIGKLWTVTFGASGPRPALAEKARTADGGTTDKDRLSQLAELETETPNHGSRRQKKE